MTGYLVSLLMGLAVGVAYGLVQVRSPAPPMIALVGLFGMVMGQQAVDMAKRHFVPSAPTSTGDAALTEPVMPCHVFETQARQECPAADSAEPQASSVRPLRNDFPADRA
jgi:XapX domain-containing protein